MMTNTDMQIRIALLEDRLEKLTSILLQHLKRTEPDSSEHEALGKFWYEEAQTKGKSAELVRKLSEQSPDGVR